MTQELVAKLGPRSSGGRSVGAESDSVDSGQWTHVFGLCVFVCVFVCVCVVGGLE